MNVNPTVTLREITAETVNSIIRLSVAESQKGFVAANSVGAAALRQVIEHVRAKGLFKTLELSYVPGPGCPEPFYLGLGFRHTGRLDGTEVVLELPLADE